MELSEKEKGVLILAARDSIHSIFGGQVPPIIDFHYLPNLAEIGPGAFVTLTIHNRLRGCIGYISSNKNLFETVCDAAIQAATDDPRFKPLTEEEFSQTSIEISILSKLNPISNYEEIQLGVHGLVLDSGFNRGLLLPQVATENHFNLSQFLTAICDKAGIDSLAWTKRKLNIKTFTAIVFAETGDRKKTYEQN